MRILPAIDLLGGKCVRLRQGHFDEATVFSDDPLATAGSFSSLGLTSLHVVDLDGARTGTAVHHDIISSIASLPGLRVEVGGGIRTSGVLEDYLERGAWRVVLGSIALRKPKEVEGWLSRWSGDRIALAVDMHRGMLAAGGWLEGTQTTPVQFIRRFSEAGATTFICTDIGRDGMLKGPNTAWYRSLRGAFPALEIVASGGITTLEDLRALESAGMNGAIVGRAIYEGTISSDALRRWVERTEGNSEGGSNRPGNEPADGR